MKNRCRIPDQKPEKRNFHSSFEDGSVDVTDLISNRKFRGISGILFKIIEKGAARLEIKESQVKLIFKTLQEKRRWEESSSSYLTQSDPIHASH